MLTHTRRNDLLNACSVAFRARVACFPCPCPAALFAAVFGRVWRVGLERRNVAASVRVVFQSGGGVRVQDMDVCGPLRTGTANGARVACPCPFPVYQRTFRTCPVRGLEPRAERRTINGKTGRARRRVPCVWLFNGGGVSGRGGGVLCGVLGVLNGGGGVVVPVGGGVPRRQRHDANGQGHAKHGGGVFLGAFVL